jgi:hypothetical protein
MGWLTTLSTVVRPQRVDAQYFPVFRCFSDVGVVGTRCGSLIAPYFFQKNFGTVSPILSGAYIQEEDKLINFYFFNRRNYLQIHIPCTMACHGRPAAQPRTSSTSTRARPPQLPHNPPHGRLLLHASTQRCGLRFSMVFHSPPGGNSGSPDALRGRNGGSSSMLCGP